MFVNGKLTVPPPLRDRLVFDNQLLLEFGEPDILYLNDGQDDSWRFRGRWKFSDGAGQTTGASTSRLGAHRGVPRSQRRRRADLMSATILDARPVLDQFREWPFPTHPARPAQTSFSSMGIAFVDINRDGLMDFFVPDMLSRSSERRKQQDLAQRATPARIGDISRRSQVARNTLFLNRGDGTFAEIAHLAGVFASEWSWSPVFLDVDLDGYEDLLITTGHLRDIQDLDATRQIQALQSSWKRPADLAALQRSFVEAKREHMNCIHVPQHAGCSLSQPRKPSLPGRDPSVGSRSTLRAAWHRPGRSRQ